MPRLQDFKAPLVFKFDDLPATAVLDAPDDAQNFHVEVRALEGMQKEATVRQSERSGQAWRMVSDEGPYLNGTDLAPFPLAFFAAGLHFCYMTQLVRLCRDLGIALRGLRSGQDTRYTMTGSALKGDMTGAGIPVDLDVAIDAELSPEAAGKLIARALAESPGHAVMRDLFRNTFALQLNGSTVKLVDQEHSPNALFPDPVRGFESIRPTLAGHFHPDIITKTETVEVQHGVTGGAGSSLKSEQKRTLHVRSDACLLDKGLLQTDIRLFQPLGSSFRFLSDTGTGDTAPPPLAYLSAGIGFCYMTQLGRYAHITKQKLESMRIVQTNGYKPSGAAGPNAAATAVDTHVYINADESEDVARKSVRMGEQTCFLHASMREAYPTVLRATLNGKPLPVPAA
ncbi:MAG: OsmC family protein [Acidobacteriota bacterium]|nr:OsmC family protein [Acidobacteriota bacterium]